MRATTKIQQQTELNIGNTCRELNTVMLCNAIFIAHSTVSRKRHNCEACSYYQEDFSETNITYIGEKVTFQCYH